PRETRAPRLLARPNPTFSVFWMRRTAGNRSASIAWVPSLDPLSTTIDSVSRDGAAARTAARARARYSRVFQLTTTIDTSGGRVTVGGRAPERPRRPEGFGRRTARRRTPQIGRASCRERV